VVGVDGVGSFLSRTQQGRVNRTPRFCGGGAENRVLTEGFVPNRRDEDPRPVCMAEGAELSLPLTTEPIADANGVLFKNPRRSHGIQPASDKQELKGLQG
jgi:hypothetical protein